MKYLRYDQLIELVKTNKCKKIVEVGTHKGNSALRMINASLDSCLNAEDIYYYGFDLFELMTQEVFEKEVSKWAPSELKVSKTLAKTGVNIKLYKGFSKDTIPLFVKEGVTPDFIFIDGGHSIETLENDWDLIKEVADKDTIIVLDDYISNFDKKKYGCNGLADTLDRNKWDVDILPVTDVINEELSIQFVKIQKK